MGPLISHAVLIHRRKTKVRSAKMYMLDRSLIESLKKRTPKGSDCDSRSLIADDGPYGIYEMNIP